MVPGECRITWLLTSYGSEEFIIFIFILLSTLIFIVIFILIFVYRIADYSV